MAVTLEVEVMYGTVDSATGLYERKRVGLDAAPTLDRENVLAVILSDVTTAARSRRTVNGNNVERIAEAVLFNNLDGAMLARHGGLVTLNTIIGIPSWTWIKDTDSLAASDVSGIPPVAPKNAIRFYPPTTVSSYMRSKADTEMRADMY